MGVELFQNIIGYDDIKKNLERLIDILNHKEKYEKIGSSIPNGLLLYGPPGLGKTTFSMEVLNFVQRKHYIIRKSKADGNFMDYMSSIFQDAKENQPSIILLDDLDKFAEDDNTVNCEELVAVQSLIDDIKEEDIFVIATANNKHVLPDSLLRSGRFDIKIKIGYPNEKDSYKILKHYLRNKKIGSDVNIKNISYILSSFSSADLEKVCNQAGIYAAYKNKDKIGNEELLRASLELSYNTNIEDWEEEDNPYILNTAYHEAGHAIVGNYLEKGSVTFITVFRTNSDTKGYTKYQNNDHYFEDITFMENRVITLLAGKAATEIVFHKCDTGSNSDLQRAYDIVERFIDDYCMLDFNSWIRNREEQSEKVKQSKDENINCFIQKYYTKAKEILIQNRYSLDKLANTLVNKKILFQEEIQTITNNS
ncbi:MAG: AAA family ATPase [Bacilli bacterium]|nr:AAA family ATPase [Bacilli bacterium]